MSSFYLYVFHGGPLHSQARLIVHHKVGEALHVLGLRLHHRHLLVAKDLGVQVVLEGLAVGLMTA